jgi:hypothetical protein
MTINNQDGKNEKRFWKKIKEVIEKKKNQMRKYPFLYFQGKKKTAIEDIGKCLPKK